MKHKAQFPYIVTRSEFCDRRIVLFGLQYLSIIVGKHFVYWRQPLEDEKHSIRTIEHYLQPLE